MDRNRYTLIWLRDNYKIILESKKSVFKCLDKYQELADEIKKDSYILDEFTGKTIKSFKYTIRTEETVVKCNYKERYHL